jgi:hypothetical protein
MELVAVAEILSRLGRLLRPKPDSNRKARLIEIISLGTRETGTSTKGKRH